jgi:SAM-dependent methyltransferase
MLPTENDFRLALQAFRERWPHDGYFDQNERFIVTYSLFRAYYSQGIIVDVGGWPGDFSCTLGSLGFPIRLLDKELTRPTSKTFDHVTGRWILSPSGTLEEKCKQYNVETIECDIERQVIPIDDGSVDCIIFTEVIEHLRVNILSILCEFRRVLRRGGKVVITTPNLLTLQNRVSFLIGCARYDTLEMPYDALEAEQRIGHTGHFRVFSMPELIDLLQRSSFRICYRGYRQILVAGENESPSLYAVRLRLLNALKKWIPQVGNQLLVVASRD